MRRRPRDARAEEAERRRGEAVRKQQEDEEEHVKDDAKDDEEEEENEQNQIEKHLHFDEYCFQMKCPETINLTMISMKIH